MLCVSEAKKKKDATWRKLGNQRNYRNRKQYIEGQNTYIKIRREEERKFEEDVIEMCEEEPKLFYKCINGKMMN